MRPKVVLIAGGLAALILAPTLYFRFAPSASNSPSNPPMEIATAPAPAPAVEAARPLWKKIQQDQTAPGAEGMDDSSASNHEDAVAQRVAELAQLGMSDDPADLKVITSELSNKEPEIRKAALSAAIQFGGQDAIPALKNQLAWTEDPEEKMDILKAIKFLELPSFQEFSARLAAANPAQSNEQPAPSN